MSIITSLSNSVFKPEDITEILDDVNHLFVPNLKSRILKRTGMKSFNEYIDKVSCNGSILLSYNKIEIEGICMIYHNNTISGEAYIPLLVIKNKFQNKGIGDKLIEYSFELAKNHKMKKVIVRTWSTNYNAIKFYCKKGFIIKEQNDNDLTLEKKL